MIVAIVKSPKKLEFTPLEFETACALCRCRDAIVLEFTPLEFETVQILELKKAPHY